MIHVVNGVESQTQKHVWVSAHTHTLLDLWVGVSNSTPATVSGQAPKAWFLELSPVRSSSSLGDNWDWGKKSARQAQRTMFLEPRRGLDEGATRSLLAQ